ncbi:hypothetical protein [Streptomyces sp. WZ-12]|uniref:hypothetical protein n=1 Tax=Streptomyces sp. WZ-12 TaxID=3030210 RepID=UPI002380FAAF|nr:hypothetical protein [Streptomyces sp. WZ-12]
MLSNADEVAASSFLGQGAGTQSGASVEVQAVPATPAAPTAPSPLAEPKFEPEPEPATATPPKKRGAAREGAGRKVGTSPSKRSTQAPPAPEYGRVQREVWKSFINSRVHSRTWDSHGVNLIPDLWRLLKSRVQADRKATGRSELTLGHYLDAALRTAPLDQDKLVKMADGLQVELEGLPKGKKSTLSLSPEAISNFGEILELLDAADYNRKGKDAICALVLQLLRDLKDEGPMPKPPAKPLM